MFTVFEGIDGSGKTTLSSRVVRQLLQRGISVKHLRADGKFSSAVAETLRALTRDSRNLDLLPKTEFLLYVAREVQQIGEVLRPALGNHQVVVADRFLYTPEVMGRFGRQLDPLWVRQILDAAQDGVTPDLVLLIDVDPFLARARRKSGKIGQAKRAPSRKSLAGVGLQRRMRQGYLELAAAEPERWVKLDNGGELEESVLRVCALIESALELGVPAALAKHRAEAMPAVSNVRATNGESRPAELSTDGSGAGTSRLGPGHHALDDPAGALDRFLSWVEHRAQHEPAVAAYVLSGLSGGRVDELRLRIAERAPEALLAGLSGLTDEVSWRLRLASMRDHPQAVARSLVGVPNTDARARNLRLELSATAAAEVAASVVALDDEGAWEIRERWYEHHPDAVMASLARLDSERAWQMRERWLSTRGAELDKNYELASIAARGVTAVGGERAWAVRTSARAAAPISALKSIGDLVDPTSWQWRAALLGSAPRPVMQTLRNVRMRQAWEMRAAAAPECKEVLDSIFGMDDPEAWALRTEYADLWPSTVVKSLGPLALEDRGRTLVARQLARHGDDLGVLRHASAVALALERAASSDEPMAGPASDWALNQV